MQDIDYEVPARQELEAGERLLWSGRPRGGIVVQGRDIPSIGFAIMWCGFVVFWESMVVKGYMSSPKGPPIFMVFWGIPFVCVGLYMLIGRFLFDAWKRNRTFFAITDRRAIVVTTGRTKRTQSFPFTTMQEVELEERSDGTGNIFFGGFPQVIGRNNFNQASLRPGFYRLEMVREVYRELLAARDTHAKVA